MEKRFLWGLLVVLLVVNGFLLLRMRQMGESFQDRYQDLRRDAATSRLEAEYADEEQAILTGSPILPRDFPRLGETRTPTGDGAGTPAIAESSLHFFLLVSIEDCTNCIEDEIAQLNRLTVEDPEGLAGSWVYFVDEGREAEVEPLVEYLSPSPLMPLTVDDPTSLIPQATTPLVLVVRDGDRRILDVHKPIPQDLTRRDAFYARWRALLGTEASTMEGP